MSKNDKNSPGGPSLLNPPLPLPIPGSSFSTFQQISLARPSKKKFFFTKTLPFHVTNNKPLGRRQMDPLLQGWGGTQATQSPGGQDAQPRALLVT